MKFGKIFVLTATLSLLLMAAVPAFAAPRVETVNVLIDNRTGARVQLVLNGPGETTRVSVANQVKDLKLELEAGAYFYKYTACGHQYSGTFQATGNESVLLLKKCGGVATSNIVIDNQTGSPFIVTLSGMGGQYGFWVPVGGMNIAIPAGGYQFNSNACADGAGTIKASASLNQPLIWSWDCKGGDEPVLTASPE